MTLQRIACDYFTEMIKHSQVDIENPWKDAPAAAVSPPAKQPEVQSAPASSSVIEYNEHGAAQGIHRRLVIDKGFKEASLMKNKASGTLISVCNTYPKTPFDNMSKAIHNINKFVCILFFIFC